MGFVLSVSAAQLPGTTTNDNAAVGNYGEMFERNVGKASPLKLDRGLNATWSKGGLMYAIPFK